MQHLIKVSDYIMKFLEEKKVREVFMLPGGGAMHLVDSLGRAEKIHYTCFQHEQGAAIAAEAYGQHTNRPGVVLVTSGPGATNTLTAVTAGWIDSTPMLILSGQAKRSDLVGDTGVRQIGSQEVQIIDMVKPITKYAVQVMQPEDIRFHLEKAWHEATTGRPGPVWLSLPLDVQGALVEERALPAFTPVQKEADNLEPLAADILKLLTESRRPLILAGNGIKLADACEPFRALLHYLQIPVLTTWKAIDLVGSDDRLFAGHPGIMGHRSANLILQRADLLLCIGSRLDTSITAFQEAHFGFNAKKVIIDIDQNELNRMHLENVVCAKACDAGELISALFTMAKAAAPVSVPDWLEECRLLRQQYPAVEQAGNADDAAVSAYYFIERLCAELTADDVIVPESSGGAGEITYQAWQLKYGQKMKNAAGLGSMGFGLPYAIGSCIANGGRRTILINGDGAFQLNIQELETLHRLNLPVKIFIWDNQGYGSIRTMQTNTFDGRFVACHAGSGFTVPDIAKVAAAYGFQTDLLENNRAVDSRLAHILHQPGSCLCIVRVLPDETVSPRVKAALQPDGSMVSGTLENMWPYLTDNRNGD